MVRKLMRIIAVSVAAAAGLAFNSYPYVAVNGSGEILSADSPENPDPAFSSGVQSPADSGGAVTTPAALPDNLSAAGPEDKTVLPLGYSLIKPSVSFMGYEVAEGSVQLLDGTWESIPRSDLLKGPYFMLLREQTDTAGVEWYICRSSAQLIGDHIVSDGSLPPELWLLKSDCTMTGELKLDTANATRQNIVRTALSLLGAPYAYGASGPDSFDCSGFVQYVLGANGIEVPHSSADFLSMEGQITKDQLRPGDVLARDGHVGIYIGDGYFVHASDSATGVVTEYISYYELTRPFTNFVNVAGD